MSLTTLRTTAGRRRSPAPSPIAASPTATGTGPALRPAVGRRPSRTLSWATSFEGLNLFQQRYARGGNQFTVEPPDQALCVGNGFVVEAVNDVMNVYDKQGNSVLPDNTATNVVSGFPTRRRPRRRPQLVLRVRPGDQPLDRCAGPEHHRPGLPLRRRDPALLRRGAHPGVAAERHAHPRNHIDIAVSKTSNPTGAWNIFTFDVDPRRHQHRRGEPRALPRRLPAHRGRRQRRLHHDQRLPVVGATASPAPRSTPCPRRSWPPAPSTVTMAHIDTSGTVPLPSDAGATQPGFTVWPAQSPGTSSYETAAGGTEYFLSSNAADEATHPVAGTGGTARRRAGRRLGPDQHVVAQQRDRPACR